MISAGNDVVALAAIDIRRSNTLAFYSKFTLVPELSVYDEPGFKRMPFHVFTWMLWSVKESAYKYFKRLDTKLIFSPTRIIVQDIAAPKANNNVTTDIWESDAQDEGFYHGKVTFGEKTLYFRSKITDQFIATVVNDKANFENVYWGVKYINDTKHAEQSAAVRFFALNKLKTVSKKESLQIGKKSAGIPIIINDGEVTGIPVSLAHHGHFVSYSLLVTP